MYAFASSWALTLVTHLLGLLWNKYWVSTLSQSPLFTNREYGNKQIREHALKVKDAARKQKSGMMAGRVRELAPSGPGDTGIKVAKDATMDQLVRGGNKIATEEGAGLLAGEVKRRLFWGIVPEARQKIAAVQQQQLQQSAVNGETDAPT